ncbi:hypothetical protein GC197_06670 [bacterium]|nr:hypothetical protein [bacterium]
MTKKKRSEQGRALFYSRDSEGRHEQTPSQYVLWAIREASQHGLRFDGTAVKIEKMLRDQRSIDGDIFFDYGIKGNTMSREGLDALRRTAESDMEVSHILIPRRDRLSRPDDPVDAVALETGLRRLGITLVFMSATLKPLGPRERPDLSESLLAMIDYDRAGKDRLDLAQKMIHTQLALAKAGYSTGGNPPYGFRRWLIREDGTMIRELEPGEIVRMSGHHVVWAPTQEDELEVIRRILELLKTETACRVAKTLTEEGTPTPAGDRYRTDNGVRHKPSGVWHSNTVTNIARNPLLHAVVEHGHRSMGDQLRLTPEGPRPLTEDDICPVTQKPRVVRNSRENLVIAPALIEPVVDPDEHQELIKVLDERGGTQRGKPRSRDPDRNPLGCRVYDMECGWPMYRFPYNDAFRYKCALYQQSSGAECNHNQVDGMAAVRFALSCVKQRLLSPTLMPKLEQRLRQLAMDDQGNDKLAKEVSRKRSELDDARREKEEVGKNLARAKSDAQFEVISQEFENQEKRIQELQKELNRLEKQSASASTGSDDVEVTLELVRKLTKLADGPKSLKLVRQLFDLIDVKLFLKFQKVQPKKRVINRLASGVLTFGSTPPPVEIYRGATAREKVRAPKETINLPPEGTVCPNGESKSLGNRSRGDTI